MLFPEAGRGRSRRSALPQSVLALQTLFSSCSVSPISAQITVLLDSPAVIHRKMHRWDSYLLIRPWDIETCPQRLPKWLTASCTTVLFAHQLHNVPSVSYHQLEGFTEAERRRVGKQNFLGSCREEGEWQQKYPSTWDTHTQVCETSVYCMPQVTSLNNVFSF